MHLPDRSGIFKGIVDRRGSELPCQVQKALKAIRRRRRMPFSDEGHPSAAFDRKEVPGFAARWFSGKVTVTSSRSALPKPRRPRWRSSISMPISVCSGCGSPSDFSNASVSDPCPEASTMRSARSDLTGLSTTPHRTSVTEPSSAATSSTTRQRSSSMTLVSFRRRCRIDVLDQRPRHRVTHPAEVALRKRIETRHFHPDIGRRPGRHRSSLRKIPIKVRKKLAKRPQSAGQKPVQMPGLRHARPSRRLRPEFVPFQHRDVVEITGERRGRRQAAIPAPMTTA